MLLKEKKLSICFLLLLYSSFGQEITRSSLQDIQLSEYPEIIGKSKTRMFKWAFYVVFVECAPGIFCIDFRYTSDVVGSDLIYLI